MMLRFKFLAIVAIIVLSTTICAQNPAYGKNEVTIRGRPQNIYFCPAEGTTQHRKILFAPGDGGWRGFAITIAKELAKAGYDVYGIDTRRYLESFTGPVVLSTADIASDFNQMARWIQQRGQESLLLVGWSEGAGFGLAAAGDPATRRSLMAYSRLVRRKTTFWLGTGQTSAHRSPRGCPTSRHSRAPTSWQRFRHCRYL